MQRLFVFLATACLLLRLGACMETVLTCGSHVHRLDCDEGVIRMDTAFYGRVDNTTCAAGRPAEEVANTACSHHDALTVLKTRCNGKKLCELNSGVFTEDPCSDTFKYLKSSFSCIPANHHIVCEHSFAQLHCEDGKVINVLGADFGRRDHTTCSFRRDPSHLMKIDCSKPVSALGEKCNGKSSCEMRAAELTLDGSCVGTSHYLEFAYTCVRLHLRPTSGSGLDTV